MNGGPSRMDRMRMQLQQAHQSLDMVNRVLVALLSRSNGEIELTQEEFQRAHEKMQEGQMLSMRGKDGKVFVKLEAAMTAPLPAPAAPVLTAVPTPDPTSTATGEKAP